MRRAGRGLSHVKARNGLVSLARCTRWPVLHAVARCREASSCLEQHPHRLAVRISCREGVRRGWLLALPIRDLGTLFLILLHSTADQTGQSNTTTCSLLLVYLQPSIITLSLQTLTFFRYPLTTLSRSAPISFSSSPIRNLRFSCPQSSLALRIYLFEQFFAHSLEIITQGFKSRSLVELFLLKTRFCEAEALLQHNNKDITPSFG